MNLLARLWPFRGGDVATAVTDDDFVSVPRRPFPLTKLLAAPEHPFTLIPPIPLTERRLDERDTTSLRFGWWGRWSGGRWDWNWSNGAWHNETHWLPASVEVLPVRCCPPEV